MNTLSWLIYLADVSGDIDAVLWVVAILATVISVLAAFIGMVVAFDEEGKEVSKLAWRLFFTRSLPLALIFSILSGFVPAKETVYAIAASEVGEEVLDGTNGRALNAWLDRQIAGEPAEEAPANEQ